MQGIVGVGQGVPPCVNCYGAPTGTIVISPAYQVVNGYTEPGVVYYYCVVETENLGGAATNTVDLVEATTHKVTQHLSAQLILSASSTNLLVFSVEVPENDGYKGAEIVIFTTTLGASTVQGRAYLWSCRHIRRDAGPRRANATIG